MHFALTIFILSGCHQVLKGDSINIYDLYYSTPHFTGTVINTFDNAIDSTILIRAHSSQNNRFVAGGAVRVSTNTYLCDSIIEFMSGDEVIVYFDGTITDCIPNRRIDGTYAIVLTSQCKRSAWIDVTQIVVAHIQDDHISEFVTSEQPAMDKLYDWFVNLILKRVQLADGKNPGEMDATRIYDFTIYNRNDEYISFIYGEFGMGDWFLYFFNEWYRVHNQTVFNFQESQYFEQVQR